MISEWGCEFEKEGNEMMKWLKDTLKEQQSDEKVVWKASAMHHPMFGVHYTDNMHIQNDFMPLIKEFGFDAYFNGHEHMQNYAYFDFTESPSPIPRPHSDLGDIDCSVADEWFPQGGPEKETREVTYHQDGNRIHQFTAGFSGCAGYLLCQTGLEATIGKFLYTENKFNGFALVYVNEEEFTVQFKGVENWNPMPFEPEHPSNFAKPAAYFSGLPDPESAEKSKPKVIRDLFKVTLLKQKEET